MEPLVSICCLAYNHEKYIEECLNSFLSQKTDFPYEIIVHDDASTDRTAEIIRRYADTYPDVVRPVFQTENQYAKNGIPGLYMNFLYPLVRGIYIAYCEGDDYWTDPEKLQKQVGILENEPNCHMCCHRVRVTGEKEEYFYPQRPMETGVYDSYEFMKGLTDGWFFHTSSFMCRTSDIRKLMDSMPEFYRASDLDDVPLLLYFGNLGKNYYLDECMSCYRRDSQDNWTERQKGRLERIFHHKETMIDVYRKYDLYTDGHYRDLTTHWINNEAFMIAEYQHDFKEMAKPKYREFLKRRSLKYRLKVIAASLLPQKMVH